MYLRTGKRLSRALTEVAIHFKPTPHSMFPRMWAATGVPYPELVAQLIRLAQQRPLGLR